MAKRIFALLLLLGLGACASVQAPFSAHLGSASAPLRSCADWYRALDEEVDAAGVRDGQYARIPGFPYLRVDRFFASMRATAALNPGALQAFSERLLELDLESRRHEIANLPRGAFERLPGMAFARDAAVMRRTEECGRLLHEADAASPEAVRALVENAVVPDDYSDAARVVGLYPLTRALFFRGVERWQEEARAAFGRELQPLEGQVVVRYAPPPAAAMPRSVVAGMLGRAGLDALGMPILTPRELGLLAAAYAPSFEIVVGGDYDRFGELRWRRGAATPEVDAANPVVYVNPAYTRYGDSVLLQLVYTLWFPERPPLRELDALAGRLDGLVWRVTLAPDGEPLIYDSIHACGCYHEFFPTPRAQVRPAPNDREEWAFVPQGLPAIAEGARPMLRIASATHYIERVTVPRGEVSLARYSIEPYNELRSLVSLEGGSRSLFAPDGLVAGTERPERLFFWPMGIASAGAMRQWGRHATAFVGRRHFDDPDLFERRFHLDVAEGPR